MEYRRDTWQCVRFAVISGGPPFIHVFLFFLTVTRTRGQTLLARNQKRKKKKQEKKKKMLMDEPPKLSNQKTSASMTSSFHSVDEDVVAKPPTIPRHDDHNVVYQIMYPQSVTSSDACYPSRPLTPLQITITDENSSPTVPVSCGTATGKMHLHMFLCPGIHMPCIEFGNELLSPKQFTVRGDKERQKDWKASIRVGRSSLRTHMEAATIDFYDHSNRCSGKCQSRNYVNAPVEREEVMQSRRAKRNADASFLKTEFENEMLGKDETGSTTTTTTTSSATATTTQTTSSKGNELDEEKKTKKARGRPRGSLNKPRHTVMPFPNAAHSMKIDDDESSSLFDEFFTPHEPMMVVAPTTATTTNQQQTPPPPPLMLHPHAAASPFPQSERNLSGCSSFMDIVDCLQNDPHNFWSQMQNTSVIGHFCDDLIVSAINLKQAAIDQPMNTSLATMLSRTVFALGIQTVVVHRVQSIERGVNQQRKHDQMLMEIQANVEEQQRLQKAAAAAAAAATSSSSSVSSSTPPPQAPQTTSTSSEATGAGDVAAAAADKDSSSSNDDEYIDVVGFTQL